MNKLTVLFLIALIICGCTSSAIKGQVYVDSNTNGVVDPDETGLSFAKMTVTKDGKKYSQIIADQNGHFVVRLKDRDGEFCFYFSDKSTKSKKALEESISSAKAATTTPVTTQPGVTTTTPPATSTVDGTSTTKPNTTTTTTTTETTPSGSWRDKDTFCITVKNNLQDIEMNIPVKFDTETLLSDLPEPIKMTYHPGDVFPIKIYKPAGSILKPFILPTGLKVATVSQSSNITYNSGLNQVVFGKTEAKASSIHTIPVSGIEAVEVQLQVNNDLPYGKYDVTLKPKADFDGQVIDLKPISLVISHIIEAKVVMSLDSPPAPGNHNAEFSVRVTNVGKTTIDEGTLVIEPPSGVNMTNSERDCTSHQCTIQNLVADQPIEYSFEVTNIPVDTTNRTYKFRARFSSTNLDTPIEAEPLEITQPAGP